MAGKFEYPSVATSSRSCLRLRLSLAAAHSNLKAVTLELGGKSPTIIFPDADLEEAVPACTFSISWNSGGA